MASVVISGDTSGAATISAPAVAGTPTLTLPTTTDTLVGKATTDTLTNKTLTSPTIATPTMTGQATIPTINLTGGQITFPATQSASSDANTLDDYEEGTWTPTDASAAGLTLTTQYAKYTKIGNMVYFCAEITYPSNSDGNRVSVGGLPFTSNSAMAYGGFVRYTNSSQTIPTLLIGPSLTRMEAYQNSGSSFTNSQISLDRFDIVGMYQV